MPCERALAVVSQSNWERTDKTFLTCFSYRGILVNTNCIMFYWVNIIYFLWMSHLEIIELTKEWTNKHMTNYQFPLHEHPCSWQVTIEVDIHCIWNWSYKVLNEDNFLMLLVITIHEGITFHYSLLDLLVLKQQINVEHTREINL